MFRERGREIGPIDTEDILENNIRWKYFKAGYEVGMKDGINHIKNSVQSASQVYTHEAETSEPPLKAEKIYENMCKLEVITKEKK